MKEVPWRQIKQRNQSIRITCGGLLKTQFIDPHLVSDSLNWGWGYRICNFCKFPCDADVATLGTHFENH